MFDESDVIYSYTRRQAIEDGVLVEVSREVAGQAGFKCSMALTSAVFQGCVEWPKCEPGQDELGRLWDVLWMARCAAARAPDSSQTPFQILRVERGSEAPTRIDLRLVIGPGDDGEAVATIMEAGED